MPKKKPKLKIERMAFEESLNELEQVVADLEQGNLGLEDSLAKYEKGIRLLKLCHESLNEVERKIQLVTRVDKDGNAQLEDLDEQATTEIDSSERARKRGYGGRQDMDDDQRLF